MPSSVFLGLMLIALAGALEGLFSLGLTRTPRWRWEISWGLGSLIALVAVPWPIALATVPGLGAAYHGVPGARLWAVFLFGVGWGLGGIFWGKAIAALGMALGVSLLMALINVFGSLAPFALFQRAKMATSGGMCLFAAIAVMIVGIACMANAGRRKERDIAAGDAAKPPEQRRPFSTGLIFCLLSGVLSAMVNFSFIFGGDVAAAAGRNGAPSWARGFAIWALTFSGCYLVNFLYALALAMRNRSIGDIARGDRRHWFWVVFMGIAWPGGIAVYGMGAYMLGDYGAYVGFPMMLVCSILFANLAGAVTGEWKGVSGGAVRWMALGVAFSAVALGLMGWSNRLLAR
jgi:L-rhamnose-H+ transport protein